MLLVAHVGVSHNDVIANLNIVARFIYIPPTKSCMLKFDVFVPAIPLTVVVEAMRLDNE